MNRSIVCMSLNPYIVAERPERPRDTIDDSQCFGLHNGRPCVKKSGFSQTDGQASRILGQADVVVRNFMFEQALELRLHLANRAAFPAFSGFRGVDKLCSVKAGVVVSNDTFRIGRQATVIIKRYNLARRREHGHFFKSNLNCLRDLTCFLLVGVRCSKHDYEEGKEQCDEVGIRHEPSLMVHVFGMLLFSGHQAAFFLLLDAACSWRSFWNSSSRNAVSLPSISLGF